MKNIIDYIETAKNEFEKHPFFTQFLSNTDLPGEKRLSWAPSTIPFIMGYADLNTYIFRKEKPDGVADPIQAMLNAHTYEEDFHWQWLLRDLDKVNADMKMPLSDAIRVLWGPGFEHSRRLSLELTATATQLESYGLFALMEAIEAVSIVLFRSCQGITMQNGEECEFFGTKHYIAESSHAINDPGFADLDLPALKDDEREKAQVVVDRVFRLFNDWVDSLLQYARNVDEHSVSYEQMIIQSKRMGPVEPVSYFVWEGHEMILKGKQHNQYDGHQEQEDQSEGVQAIPG